MPRRQETAKPAKPARPFSAYTIFLQLERELLLLSKDLPSKFWADLPPPSSEKDLDTDPRPPRYQHMDLPAEWYIAKQKKEKRKHRKSHGMFTFLELTSTISKRWKIIDEEVKRYCKKMSERGSDVYRSNMKAYNEAHGIATAPAVKKHPFKINKKSRKSSSSSIPQKQFLISSNNTITQERSAFLSETSFGARTSYSKPPPESSSLSDDINYFFGSLVQEDSLVPPNTRPASDLCCQSCDLLEVDMRDEEILSFYETVAAYSEGEKSASWEGAFCKLIQQP